MSQRQNSVECKNENWERMFSEYEHSNNHDLKIEVTNGDVKKVLTVHKNVMAAGSLYLANKISQDTEDNVLEINGLDVNSVSHLINSMYSQVLSMNEANMLKYFETACILQMNRPVIETAKLYLKHRLNTRNVIKIKELAEKYEETDLIDCCVKFKCRNFNDLINSPSLADLSYTDMTRLCNSSSITVKNELDVAAIIKKWVSFNFKAREMYIGPLLKAIRLSTMPSNDLAKLTTENILHNNKFLCRIIKEYQSRLVEMETKIPSKCEHPRSYTPYPCIISIGGIHTDGRNEEKLADVLVSPDNLQTWYKGESMPEHRNAFAITCCKDKVYVIGGHGKDTVDPLDTTFCYTTETNMWTTEKNLPGRRSSAAACSVGNKVYLSGGYLPDPSNRRSTLSEKLEVYQYDTDHKTWTKLTELNHRRSEHTMAAINGELYIVGGKGPKSSCEKIDLKLNKPISIRIAGMNEGRSQHSMDVCNRVLYVAGGYNNGVELQSVEKYDPRSYIWTTMTNNLLSARRMAQMVSLHQNLIIIGGINGMEHIDLIESCLSGDEEMDWTYETRFPKKVIFHGVLVFYPNTLQDEQNSGKAPFQVLKPRQRQSLKMSQRQNSVECINENSERMFSEYGHPNNYDLKLEVTNGDVKKELTVHKNVMAAGSLYLANKITQDTEDNVIEINGLDVESVSHLINVMYKRYQCSSVINVQALSMNEANMCKYFETACILQMNMPVIDTAMFYLKEHLNTRNVIKIKELAEKYEETDLIDYCFKFMCSNFNDLINSPSLADLSHTDMTRLCNSSSIIVRNELDVAAIIKKWVCFNFKAREIYIGTLSKAIRLSTMPSNDLVKFITEKILHNNKFLCRIIKEYHSRLVEIPNRCEHPRSYTPYPCIISIGGIHKDGRNEEKLADVLVSPDNLQTWYEAESMPEHRYAFAITCCEGKNITYNK
ncbi:Kelch-like protein 8 [Nymphon striatum]|nr:Kelch-like protein 8 [Nymphon striatum]